MLHCGWRGLAGGIVARGAEEVGATAAAIGPGIGPCCYEVGEEVLDEFAPSASGSPTGGCSTCAEVARRLLAGRESSGRVDGLCTSCEPELFFSHRRDGGADRPPGRVADEAMPEPIRGIEPDAVRRNLERVRERGGPEVEILAATKYVPGRGDGRAGRGRGEAGR